MSIKPTGIYWDSSSLIKRYIKEEGSEVTERLFKSQNLIKDYKMLEWIWASSLVKDFINRASTPEPDPQEPVVLVPPVYYHLV